ncbi:MAG: hypothetical protein ABI811_02580 [Acidobacteriota bacterium]
MPKHLVFLAIATCACAQQTIFNVPSADIAVKNDWFYQHQTVVRAWDGQRRWVQTNAFGYGIGHFLELDTTWYNLEPHHLKQSAASVGFKFSLPLREESRRWPLKLVAGDMVEFRDRSETPQLRSLHEGNWGYLMLFTELPKSHTRITAGGSTGTQILFGRKEAGFLGGVEQPLSDRWVFQLDWFSGHHDLAYWIPGVVYRFTTHWMVSLGYQVPNRPTGGFQGVVFELTRF